VRAGQISPLNQTRPWRNMYRFLVFFCLLSLSSALFFGRRARSSCSSDRQCGRSRCIERDDFGCHVGNLFGRRNGRCKYRECAQCFTNLDCRNDQYCSAYRCLQDTSQYNNPYQYNPNIPYYNYNNNNGKK